MIGKVKAPVHPAPQIASSHSMVHIPPKYFSIDIIYFYNYYSLFGFVTDLLYILFYYLLVFLQTVYLGQLLLLEQIDLLPF